ncbi:MAG: ComF family protein [Magnetococcales bacterium]|nr:ComF family protein [Magnetococcales bacterium]
MTGQDFPALLETFRVPGVVVHWRRKLLDGLFPPGCPLCHVSVSGVHTLCLDCLDGLPPAPENHCLRCGRSTGRPEAGCAGCLNDAEASDAVYFAFQYEGLAARLILGFKFADRSEWGVLLGRLCWERLGRALEWERPEWVIPMPLHPWRLLGRRYNQSALLAGELACRLGSPLVTDVLYRRRRTRPQTLLDAKSRRDNVRGVFRVQGSGVRGRVVMLVDDVMTTGATLAAAVAVLKKAGAARVIGVCLARVEYEVGVNPLVEYEVGVNPL